MRATRKISKQLNEVNRYSLMGKEDILFQFGMDEVIFIASQVSELNLLKIYRF